MTDPHSSSIPDEVLHAFEQYAERIAKGEALDIESFSKQFPAIQDELAAFLKREYTAPSRETHAPQISSESKNSPLTDSNEAPTVKVPQAFIQKSKTDSTPQDHKNLETINFESTNSQSGFDFVLNDYELKEVVGRGGMGIVFRAVQQSLNRVVAVKMIRSGVLATEKDVWRFRNEAQAAAKLQHPNIVRVYEVDTSNGHHFFSMEFISGQTLAEYHSTHQLTFQEIAELVKQVADAIQHAHDHKVAHRDLKPSNVIVSDDGRPIITDFGLAKDFDRNECVTTHGASIGTPAYMSPEQASGDVRNRVELSDVYSIGAILFELLTGRVPFDGKNALDTMVNVIDSEPPSPRSLNSQVPKPLEAICLKCLSKNPNRRYPDAKSIAEELGRYLKGEVIQARSHSRTLRTWRWIKGVPIVRAITGHRSSPPTQAQWRFQWAALTLIVVLTCATIAAFKFLGSLPVPYPDTVRIAAGPEGGEYIEFSNHLSDLVETGLDIDSQVLNTEGSIDNLNMLRSNESELGLLQYGALDSKAIAVVTPLYREYLFVIVRSASTYDDVEDLQHRNVLIGLRQSGMKLSAIRFLEHLEITANVIEGPIESFLSREDIDAVIVTSGTQSRATQNLLSHPNLRMLSLSREQSERFANEPVLRTQTIRMATLIPSIQLPDEAVEVTTAFTTTFLCVPIHSNEDFVRDILRVIHTHDSIQDHHALISKRDAATWPALPFHPTARQYFALERLKSPQPINPSP